jgi:predicted dehydrogenase
MSTPIRTAVIGAGLAAQVFHVPLILSLPDLFVLHSVVERSPPAEVQPEGTIGKKFGVKVNLVSRFEKVLEDPEIELVCFLLASNPLRWRFPY